MTLNGVIGQSFGHFTEIGSFRAHYVRLTVVEDTLILSAQKCSPKKAVFSDISFIAILAGDHPSESVKVRHSPLASENLTNNQP